MGYEDAHQLMSMRGVGITMQQMQKSTSHQNQALRTCFFLTHVTVEQLFYGIIILNNGYLQIHVWEVR